jgi:hypothetical protein
MQLAGCCKARSPGFMVQLENLKLACKHSRFILHARRVGTRYHCKIVTHQRAAAACCSLLHSSSNAELSIVHQLHQRNTRAHPSGLRLPC